MVWTYFDLPPIPYIWYRFDWQEGGEDTVNEYGYAGMSLFKFHLLVNLMGLVASQSYMPPVSL
jgi:hypothetical protein